ncbi:MAG TPA: SdrD B-like domain-containing protein [Pirellulales bacterium]|nr:SdrD B-like domain-containing protein [Pirellulales bacterium]
MPIESFFLRRIRKSTGRSPGRRWLFAEQLEERRLLTADPIVTVDTNFGNFQIELFPDAAPMTVANFRSYVESGAYTNSIFHRSVPNFVVQSGGFTSPSDTFTSTSQFATIPTNAPIPLEYNLPNIRGSVGLARTSAPNSGTDEWFVNTVDNTQTLGPSNGGGYAVFGQVLGDGMQVLDAIAALPTDAADSSTFATLPLGANNQLVRISSITVGYGIEGTVFTDFNGNGELDPGESGVAGRTVFIDNDGTGAPDASNPSTTTDANGHYSFSGLAPGPYSVREVVPANVTIAESSQTVTVTSDHGATGVNFAEEPSITGTVFVDLNGNGQQDPGEPGLPGQIVYAYRDGTFYPGGNAPSTTTDANGHYAFTGLAPGSYTVREALPANVSLTTAAPNVNVTAGATVSGVDFGELPSITGTVFNDENRNGHLDPGEHGVAGRTVFIDENGTGKISANDPSAVTDANGHYAFLTLPPGSYVVREVLPSGVELTTPLQTVTVTAGQGSFDVNFGDTIVTAPNERFLYAIYQDILARAPDSAGLAFWTQQLAAGVAPSVVAAALSHSDEYYANFVVKPGYLNILGRAADDAGLAFWTARLSTGVSDQQFEAALVASDEFYAKAGDNFDSTPDADDTTVTELDHNADWIAGVYQTLLHRAADSAGASYWLAQLGGGLSREQVALAIADSRELQVATIDQDYVHYLNRPADPAGVDYWLQQFAHGKQDEDLIAGIAGSAEYYQKYTA